MCPWQPPGGAARSDEIGKGGMGGGGIGGGKGGGGGRGGGGEEEEGGLRGMLEKQLQRIRGGLARQLRQHHSQSSDNSVSSMEGDSKREVVVEEEQARRMVEANRGEEATSRGQEAGRVHAARSLQRAPRNYNELVLDDVAFQGVQDPGLAPHAPSPLRRPTRRTVPAPCLPPILSALTSRLYEPAPRVESRPPRCDRGCILL